MADVIFDSSMRQGDPSSINHQRKILRGVRTKRSHGRRAQRQEETTSVGVAESRSQEQVPVRADASAPSSQDSQEQQITTHPGDPTPRWNGAHRNVDEYSDVMRQEKSSSNPFASYSPKPINFRFATQHLDEHVILVLRKHALTQLPWILGSIVFAFLPILFSSVGLVDFLPGTYQFAALIIWYLLLTGFIIESFLSWFFNVNIITDERIIDVDFLSLIYRNISSAKTDNIEDVTAVTSGAIRSLFDFGTVFVQTAAQQREFDFRDVPHPARVTKLLNELILEEEREKIEGRIN
ncbi:MAG: hypothetical protein WDZ94_03005 [Patescibacteria group bacterium]